jgi:hypothetical protein
MRWTPRIRREYVIPILLSVAIVIGVVRLGVETSATNDANRELSCQSARNQREQLLALEQSNIMLRAIILELSLPVALPEPIMIPEVPAECDGF